MGRIVVTEFVSLDGVDRGPGRKRGLQARRLELRVRARRRGRQVQARRDDGLRRAAAGAGHLRGLRRRPGRRARREFADKFNSMPKYVVSSTLERPRVEQLDGARRRPGRGGREAASEEHDGDIVVHGSAQLVQALLEHDLVDELRLMVFPVVLGTRQAPVRRDDRQEAAAARGLEDGRRRRRHPRLPGGLSRDRRRRSSSLATGALAELRRSLAGAVIAPADAGYDAARRCFNALDRPAAGGDRRAASAPTTSRRRFDFARAHGLEVAVRGGGHNPAGHCVLRRRARDRPLADAPGRGRRRGADRPRRGRRDLARLRLGDPGARPRHARRRRRLDRRRRPHLRRRDRPPDRPARAHLRQPRRRRARHPGRRAWSARAPTRTPSCSGGCAAAAATSASRRGSSSACTRSSASSAVGSPTRRRRRARRCAASATSSPRAPRDLSCQARARRRRVARRRSLVVAPCYTGADADPEELRALRSAPGLVDDGVREHSFIDQQHVFNPPYGEDRNYWKGHFVRELPDELIDELLERMVALGAPAGPDPDRVAARRAQGRRPDAAARRLPRRRLQHQRDGGLAGPRPRRPSTSRGRARPRRRSSPGRSAAATSTTCRPTSRSSACAPRSASRVRAPAGAEAPLRPDQRPAPQPEHPAAVAAFAEARENLPRAWRQPHRRWAR